MTPAPAMLGEIGHRAEIEGTLGRKIELATLVVATADWSEREWVAARCLPARTRAYLISEFPQLDAKLGDDETAAIAADLRAEWDRREPTKPVPTPARALLPVSPADVAAALRRYMDDPRALPETPSRYSLLCAAVMGVCSWTLAQCRELRGMLNDEEIAVALFVGLESLSIDNRIAAGPLRAVMLEGLDDQVGRLFLAFLGRWRLRERY